MTVLEFHYTVIQLSRMSWRTFLKTPNPAAAALMVKMKIAPSDRPAVLRECRRLLATLKLTEERAALIWAFVESYLQLSAQEMKQYERDDAKLTPEERQDTMKLMSTIERKGVREGQVRLLTLQIERRFGAAVPQIISRLDDLAPEHLEELGAALFDFTSLSELESWLARN